jgi:hypothetical protein
MGYHNPTVALERLFGHGVIMKALMFVCIRHGFEVMASVSSKLDPLWAGSFSAVRGCCISSHEASLMMWYVTALPSLAVLVCVSNYMI